MANQNKNTETLKKPETVEEPVSDEIEPVEEIIETDEEETSNETPTETQTANNEQTFLFPTEGISITAKNREEAEKIYHERVKAKNKESDNG